MAICIDLRGGHQVPCQILDVSSHINESSSATIVSRNVSSSMCSVMHHSPRPMNGTVEKIHSLVSRSRTKGVQDQTRDVNAVIIVAMIHICYLIVIIRVNLL